MGLRSIVKKLAFPALAATLAFSSISCKSPTENSNGLADSQVELRESDSNARIRFSFVPEKGSYANVEGMTWGVDSESYKVSLYLEVNGTYWMKPYWADPLTDIKDDGCWKTPYATGGIDQTAEKIFAFLVTEDYVPKYHTLPRLEDEKVLAGTYVER